MAILPSASLSIFVDLRNLRPTKVFSVPHDSVATLSATFAKTWISDLIFRSFWVATPSSLAELSHLCIRYFHDLKRPSFFRLFFLSIGDEFALLFSYLLLYSRLPRVVRENCSTSPLVLNTLMSKKGVAR